MLGDERRLSSGEAFHYFDVEELIPAGHILRRIDAVLDLEWVRAEVAPLYSKRGRPSIDPEVVVRMMLLGYLFGLSEVRLCDEVRMHMGYRWFCRLQPSDKVPDRTTLVKLRNHKWQQAIWVKILEHTVKQCIEVGLVSGRHVAIDGTKIRADVSIGSFEPIEPVESIRDHLLKRCGWEKYVPESSAPDEPDDDEPRPGGSSDFRGKKLKNAEVRSKTDPDALLYRKDKGEGASPAYIGSFCADTKSRVILAAEVSPGRTSGEWDAGAAMLDEVKALVGDRLQIVSADKGYGVRGFLGQVVGRGLVPHIPVQGKPTLRRVGRPRVLRSRVVNLAQGRKAVERIRVELARNHAVEQMATRGYAISRRLRLRIEHLFGEGKSCHGLARARFRGRLKVDRQAKMIAAVMNLKRLAAYCSRRTAAAAVVSSARMASVGLRTAVTAALRAVFGSIRRPATTGTAMILQSRLHQRLRRLIKLEPTFSPIAISSRGF